MPSPVRRHGRRVSVNEWRAKVGNKEVFVHERRGAVEEFIRKYTGPGKPRLIPPNRMNK